MVSEPAPCAPANMRTGHTGLDPDRARALAESLHRGQRDSSGAPLIAHVRRVAAAVPADARAVAWLHEVLEHTSIPEEALLAEGLTTDELRALRLLTRNHHSRSKTYYLAHVERLAQARGPGARMAQRVKRADLADRALNPSVRTDGWSPPYELGLETLQRAVFRRARTTPVADTAQRAPAARAAGRADTTRHEPSASWGARPAVTPGHDHVLPRTEPEFRAQRLGFALRSLATDLADERRKVAELRRKVAELKSRLESLEPTPGGNHAEPERGR